MKLKNAILENLLQKLQAVTDEIEEEKDAEEDRTMETEEVIELLSIVNNLQNACYNLENLLDID